MPEFEPIVGRYLPVSFDGFDYRIYVEESGSGCHCCACTPLPPIAANTAICSTMLP